MSRSFYGDETITTTTLAATTWTEVSAEVNIANVVMRELWNESAAGVWFAFSNTVPSDTDGARWLPDVTAYITNIGSGMSSSKLWVYSTAGGDVKYVQA